MSPPTRRHKSKTVGLGPALPEGGVVIVRGTRQAVGLAAFCFLAFGTGYTRVLIHTRVKIHQLFCISVTCPSCRNVILQWSEALVAQSCPTPCDPMDCSPPGFSVHGVFQARILEWVAVYFSGGSSLPRDQTHVSCLSRWTPYLWASREALAVVSTVQQIDSATHTPVSPPFWVSFPVRALSVGPWPIQGVLLSYLFSQ